MDFEEAFNSGKKFRLPKDCMGEGTWPDNFYWIKSSKDEIKVCLSHHDNFTFPISELDNIGNNYHDDENDLVLYRFSDDWEIIE